MILKTKAFIYRFSAIFGLRIYLAQREEDNHMAKIIYKHTVMSIIDDEEDDFYVNIERGMWHARNGFTTVYTGRLTTIRGLVAKVKHAFDFSSDLW